LGGRGRGEDYIPPNKTNLKKMVFPVLSLKREGASQTITLKGGESRVPVGRGRDEFFLLLRRREKSEPPSFRAGE